VLPQAEARIPPDGDVLQVGGRVALSRATVVLADQPGEARGRARWVVRDVCAREPWPFEDGAFAFAVCEELAGYRDPVFVASELSRVAREGYVEIPTVEAELGADASGRWLCDVAERGLVFVRRGAAGEVRVPPRWLERLGPEERVHGLFWDGALPARERLVDDDAYAAELTVRLRRRFEPSSAEVVVAEARDVARRAVGVAGGVVGRALRNR